MGEVKFTDTRRDKRRLVQLGSTVVAKAEHRQQCNLSSSAQLNTSRRTSLGKTYGAPTRWRAGPAKQEARQSPELWKEKKGNANPRQLCADANLEITAIISRVIIRIRKANGANNICHYG